MAQGFALTSRLVLKPPAAGWRLPAWRTGLRQTGSCAAFIALWKVQSQLSNLAFPLLVALSSVWLTLPVMLAWSLLATAALAFARHRGVPDLMAYPAENAPARKRRWGFNLPVLGGICVGGLHAFVYTRACHSMLDRGESRARQLMRLAALGVGLTLFGCATAHHLLKEAGYTGRKLFRLSLGAVFLNVPYHTFLSVAMTHSAIGLASRIA